MKTQKTIQREGAMQSNVSAAAPVQAKSMAPPPFQLKVDSEYMDEGQEVFENVEKAESGNDFAEVPPPSPESPPGTNGDLRPETSSQKKLQEGINSTASIRQLKSLQTSLNSSPYMVAQRQAAKSRTGSSDNLVGKNNGLPDGLRTGIESLSGIAMDDVKVHYNSAKPGQLQAHAYAQGTDIHLASGQEKHLPHEAWHVVQQKQGRVKPTTELGGTAINDHPGLESEADQMGEQAMQRQVAPATAVESMPTTNSPAQAKSVVQRIQFDEGPEAMKAMIRNSRGGIPEQNGLLSYLFGEPEDRSVTALASLEGPINIFYRFSGQPVPSWENADLLVRATRHLERELMPHLGQAEEELRGVLQTILKEVRIIRSDVEYGLQMREVMADETWGTNYNVVDQSIRGMLNRKGNYSNLNAAEDNIVFVMRFLNWVNGQMEETENEIKIRDLEGYEWGNEHGEVSEETRTLNADLGEIGRFLQNTSLVIEHLKPLADQLNGCEPGEFLPVMKAILREKEIRNGLSKPPVIPMGLLPSEVFEGLIRDGRVLDDYGAGLKHGELTHRLQWYAIFDAADRNTLQIVNPCLKIYQHSAVTARGGSSHWGDVFDRGGGIEEKTYGGPARLNRDLQESNGTVTPDTMAPGIFPRPGFETPENLGEVRNIGNALSELRELRMQEMVGKRGPLPDSAFELPRTFLRDQQVELSEEEKGKKRRYEGADLEEVMPLPELVDEKERGMEEVGSPFRLLDSGVATTDFSPVTEYWKVYEEMAEEPEQEGQREIIGQ